MIKRITSSTYEERGMRVLIMKPSIDTKGGEKLMSRLGVERRVDIAVRPDMDPLAPVSYTHLDVYKRQR